MDIGTGTCPTFQWSVEGRRKKFQISLQTHRQKRTSYVRRVDDGLRTDRGLSKLEATDTTPSIRRRNRRTDSRSFPCWSPFRSHSRLTRITTSSLCRTALEPLPGTCTSSLATMVLGVPLPTTMIHQVAAPISKFARRRRHLRKG